MRHPRKRAVRDTLDHISFATVGFAETVLYHTPSSTRARSPFTPCQARAADTFRMCRRAQKYEAIITVGDRDAWIYAGFTRRRRAAQTHARVYRCIDDRHRHTHATANENVFDVAG